MLHYPKIRSSKHCQLGPCVMFEKLDGSNLHWDWDREFGWHDFGTRRDTFSLLPEGVASFAEAHPNLAGASALFQETLAGGLDEALRATPLQSAVAFTEYLGAGSFAGLHREGDPMRLVLFDVQGDGEMLGPQQFLDWFGHLDVPRVLYQGKFRGEILEDVFLGKFGVAEGVVVKGGSGESLWMAKIKTREYMEKLKGSFGDQWADYWE